MSSPPNPAEELEALRAALAAAELARQEAEARATGAEAMVAHLKRKRGDEARLPARGMNVLGRGGARSFEPALWSTLMTTRTAGIAGSRC